MMRLHLLLLSLAAVHITPSSAASPSFKSWYGFYWNTLTHTTQKHCNTSMAAYESNPGSGTCKDLSTCLLDNIGSVNAADMTSASVILGLTPSILSTIGPTSSEVALMSVQRPILAFLLGLGVPVLYPSRPGEYDNPIRSLKKGPVLGLGSLKENMYLVYAIGIAEYVFTLAALANILSNSVQLGRQTVLVWKCMNSLIPLLWSLLPIATHFTTILAFRLSRTFKDNLSQKRESAVPMKSQYSSIGANEKKRAFLPHWIERELCPAASSLDQTLSGLEPPEEPLYIMSLSWVTTALAYIHVVFGTLVFSSLLFIGTLDALGVILRYIASALVCRAILAFEIAGMRRKKSGGDFTDRELDQIN